MLHVRDLDDSLAFYEDFEGVEKVGFLGVQRLYIGLYFLLETIQNPKPYMILLFFGWLWAPVLRL